MSEATRSADATPARGLGSAGPRAGRPRSLAGPELDALLAQALAEDIGSGDLSALHAVPASARARGSLVAKAPGRLAGLQVFGRVFELCQPEVRVELCSEDGARLEPGALLARVEGPARALLSSERTALNFAQRMSGIATLTARYVELAGGRARVLDTRKTTPLLRRLEKYAVRCGGGENHRLGLYDEVMLKDNHLDLSGMDLAALVAKVRSQIPSTVRITAEARDEQEALAAARAGADVVLLDNLGAERMRALCPELRAVAAGRALEIEASGGITEANLAQIAACGVDRVSVGALTHSAPALDLSFSLEPLP